MYNSPSLYIGVLEFELVAHPINEYPSLENPNTEIVSRAWETPESIFYILVPSTELPSLALNVIAN